MSRDYSVKRRETYFLCMKGLNVIFGFLSCFNLFAQDVNPVTTRLARPSITHISLSFENMASQSNFGDIESWRVSPFVDLNNIDKPEIVAEYDYPDFLPSYAEKEDEVERKQYFVSSRNLRQSAIVKALNKQKIPHKVLASVLTDSDGRYTDELIIKRGLNTKTDSEILIDNQSKLSFDLQSGLSLLDQSYLVLVGQLETRLINNEEREGYVAFGYFTVVQIDFSEIKSVIGRLAISEGVNFRKALMEISEIPLKVVIEGEIIDNAIQAKDNRESSMAQLKSSLKGKMYHSCMFRIKDELDVFKPQAPIFKLNPLNFKLGVKEGIKKGERFEVMENRVNRRGSTSEKHMGFVRVANVSDNSGVSRGESIPSELRQIQGKKFDRGMLVRWNDDAGVSLRTLYHTKLNNAPTRGNWLGEVQLAVLLKELDNNQKGGLTLQFDQISSADFSESDDGLGLYAGFFYSYGYMVSRNSEFEIYFSGLYTWNDEIEYSWYTEGYGGEIQTRANINIFKTAQINIGIGYRYMQLVSEFYRDPVVPANNYSETESSITINYGLTFNI